MDPSASLRHVQSSLQGADIPSKPHRRHRTSLEGVINPPADEVNHHERDRAKAVFFGILDHLERYSTTKEPYNRIEFVRLIHKHARCEESQWLVLQEFFRYTNISIDNPVDLDDAMKAEEIRTKIISFADYVNENLFLPLKASARKTPKPSPARSSQVPSRISALGSVERVASLRRDCLTRHRHRCTISRHFDLAEAERRLSEKGEDLAVDDEGQLLKGQDPDSFADLEVAHIIPHSFMTTTGNEALDESKKTARELLDMFDHGIIHLIEDFNIDRPLNAITLRIDLHRQFGDFKIYFESMQEPHKYRIGTTQRPMLRKPMFPVTRELFLTPERTIDPPSARLLAIHHAICVILQLSGAGKYIDSILRDLDDGTVRTDGSTDLGSLVRLKMGGWWHETVVG